MGEVDRDSGQQQTRLVDRSMNVISMSKKSEPFVVNGAAEFVAEKFVLARLSPMKLPLVLELRRSLRSVY